MKLVYIVRSILVVMAACWLPCNLLAGSSGSGTRPETPVFTRDVAPIIFNHCSSCHRPGQSAPFPLLSYQDVVKRARQIVSVTQSRYMPPWLPDKDVAEFQGQRLLSDQELEILQAWLEAEMPEGDLRDLPAVPEWPTGWTLGKPDLIAEMKEPFILGPEGTDVFRYFVLPLPVGRTRYVRGFEFRPGNTRIVHHARMLLDMSGRSRWLDRRDPEPGYSAGMRQAQLEDPEGHWLGWTPGKQPVLRPPEMAWELEPGTDLVIEMHMLPTGKPERIQASVGLYFSQSPPVRQPAILRLGPRDIDIAAGNADYEIRDQYELPVPIRVLNIYPHAHLLAKTMEALATLPDGRQIGLLRINNWDFNWQDEYQYKEPIDLPAGSAISMRFGYDNSNGNPRNPHHPPQRVLWGDETSAEMGDLWLQVVTDTPGDRLKLLQDFLVKDNQTRLEGLLHALGVNPEDPTVHYNLGIEFLRRGEVQSSAECFRKVIHLDPFFAEGHASLGLLFEQKHRVEDAIQSYEAAIESAPDLDRAHHRLGVLYARKGLLVQAQQHLEAARSTDPNNHDILNDLGLVFMKRNQISGAVELFRRAIESRQDFVDAHFNLGSALLQRQSWTEARRAFQETVRLSPEHAKAHNNLGGLWAMAGEVRLAEEHFREALRIDPGYEEARQNLERLLGTKQE